MKKYFIIELFMIHKATINDVKKIHALLSEYGSRGQLLSRSLSELYDHVRDFFIYTEPESHRVIGCCALQFCWEDLAEIRSLAVIPETWRQKIGTKLVEAAIAEAREFKIKSIFTLTYQSDFFATLGFQKIDRSELPIKIWKDCILCVKYPDCDETAMIRPV